MFYDYAKVFVKGGDGGNGCVAFRREKYVPEGGPSGGDGGAGGNVIFQVDPGLRTLVDFRYQHHYKAARGQHGMGKNMHGKSGEDLVIRVPPGTIVRDADSGALVADLTREGQQVVLARGGRGGRGNARFATASNKAPRMAEKGEPGEERWLELELKLLADVGLVGFPNAGKSTLISRVSAARPKIADYPFTTLTPNLGVVRMDDGNSFVMADIPGLIAGAHTGAGLGHQFLRHTGRTRLLLHVVDISGIEGRDPVEDFHVVNRELALYDRELAGRPQVVAANKMDLPGARENLTRLKQALNGRWEVFPVSALSGEGLKELIYHLARRLAELPPPTPVMESNERLTVVENGPPFTVSKQNGVFVVKGKEIERRVAMTDLDNEEAVDRLQRIISLTGLEDALREAGIREGDTVRIRDFEFEYMESL